MTEELTDAQLEGAEETQELLTPAISAGSTDAGSAEPSFDASALVSQIVEQLEPVLDKKVDARFKRAKDVRFSKVDEIYEWVKASGGDPEKIRMSLERSAYEDRLSKLEAQLTGGVGSSTPAGGAQEKRFDANRATEILTEAGVDWDNPEVEAWTKKTFTTEAQAEAALRNAITKGKKQSSIGPAASAGAAGGHVAPTGDSYDELAEQLANLRGKFDPESQKQRREIQSKMANLESGMSFVETRYDALGPA